MKKFAVIGITVIFALCSFTSCEEGLFVSKAGPADAENALKLIPKDVMAVFFIDIHRVMTIEFINNLIKEKENDETSDELTDFQEFKAKTGIDPEKDINFIVGAITGKTEKGKEEGVGIINLTYNKDLLLSLIKEELAKEKEEEHEKQAEEEHGEEEKEHGEKEEHEMIEEEYNGFTIYTVREECEEEEEEHGKEEEEHGAKHEKGGSFTFLDESNIAVGDANSVKSVIDVLQKKKENVFKNEGFSSLLTKIDKEAIFWGAALIPPDAINEVISEKPELIILEAVNAASVSLDYKNKNIIADIKIMSSDPMKNQELADNLNGYKSMAALIQIQDLNMAEILDRIEITSFPDHVKIYTSFAEDLPQTIIDKLKMKKTKEEKKDI
jgi:hypothetical protein